MSHDVQNYSWNNEDIILGKSVSTLFEYLASASASFLVERFMELPSKQSPERHAKFFDLCICENHHIPHAS